MDRPAFFHDVVAFWSPVRIAVRGKLLLPGVVLIRTRLYYIEESPTGILQRQSAYITMRYKSELGIVAS